ncbi:hypothetical protein DPMN_115093 [Dreissena polymorpha]|uniref:Uncharacterized protein n=1 Tax=Dreissena polymorpha TaxID=45954 RepID=A0A9D4QS58_DREPO|nr:hypothetical protein DPMN_115093 [Dreissena polymorpha]
MFLNYNLQESADEILYAQKSLYALPYENDVIDDIGEDDEDVGILSNVVFQEQNAEAIYTIDCIAENCGQVIHIQSIKEVRCRLHYPVWQEMLLYVMEEKH